ncbi:MAG: hypothetical protein DRP22_01825 [Verrucomicrobia bacterium]|nr:MAG: hypothetical protein DRP22_01825 [Verrucomicrobiota bacterium]
MEKEAMMRTQNRQIWLVGMLMVGIVSAAQAAGLSLAFVDMDRVFSEYYRTKLADAQLKEQADKFTEERDRLVQKLKDLREEFNRARTAAQDTSLSAEARKAKQDEAEKLLVQIREEESNLREFEQTRQKQLTDQGRRMRNRIVDQIREAVEEYARTQGFSAVLDYSGDSMNGVPVVLYVDRSVDITDEVIEILNKGSE